MKQMRFPCQQFGKTGETFGKKLGQVASLLSETKLKQGSLIYPVIYAKILKVKFNKITSNLRNICPRIW